MSKKICTPFCKANGPCVKHHDLLVSVLNCADSRSNGRHSMENLECTVTRYVKLGWNKDEDVQDPEQSFRFPLVHWASVLGKCTALEWMLDNGFLSTVRSSQSKETALHRCIMFLYKSGIRRPEQKIIRIVELLKDCLMLQDEDCDTPLHLAAKRLLHGSKPDYYGQVLETMILQTRVMPGKTAQIMDCTNKDGNTITHILARSDVCISTVRKILETGTDLMIKNKKKMVPLDVAVNSGSTRIAQVLATHVRRATVPQEAYGITVFTGESPPESPVQDFEEMKDEQPEIPLQDEQLQDEPTCSDYQDDAPQKEEEINIASGGDYHWTKEEDLIPIAQIKKEIIENCCGQCSTCLGHRDLIPVNGSCDRVPEMQEGTNLNKTTRADWSDNVTHAAAVNAPSTSADLDSSLITFLKGAGLLDNITQLANKTRLEDEHLLKEKLHSVQAMNNTIAGIEDEIENKTKALEEINLDLRRLSEERQEVHGKRKRINEECSKLQTKLHCCDNLLRYVPQSVDKGSEK